MQQSVSVMAQISLETVKTHTVLSEEPDKDCEVTSPINQIAIAAEV